MAALNNRKSHKVEKQKSVFWQRLQQLAFSSLALLKQILTIIAFCTKDKTFFALH